MAQEDPTKVDANHFTVEHEDEQVRVLRARYGPYAVIQSHPADNGPIANEAVRAFVHLRLRTASTCGMKQEVPQWLVW